MTNINILSKCSPCPICGKPTYTLYKEGEKSMCYECWFNGGPSGKGDYFRRRDDDKKKEKEKVKVEESG